jgi:hypothetical protein
MPELADEAGAGAFDGRRRALEPVLVGGVIAGDDGAMGERRRVHRDDLGDDHARAAFGALREKVDPPLGDAMGGAEIGQRRRQRNAIAQRAGADLQRAEQAWKMISDEAL